jgi:hypothetical protein
MKDTSAMAALFVDGANLHLTAKALGFDTTTESFLPNFKAAQPYCGPPYTVIIEGQEYSSIQPLLG